MFHGLSNLHPPWFMSSITMVCRAHIKLFWHCIVRGDVLACGARSVSLVAPGFACLCMYCLLLALLAFHVLWLLSPPGYESPASKKKYCL